MSYTKYISLTVLEDTCGVELPEGDAEFDDRQNLACVESFGCLISKKFRIPGKKKILTYSRVFLAMGSSRSDQSELGDHNPRDFLPA